MKTCPGCGELKLNALLVCKTCWHELPAALRAGWERAVTLTDKRVAAAAIFRHVRGLDELAPKAAPRPRRA